MSIGEALRRVRIQRDLTQTQMGAGIVTESFYSKVERGIHNIDADTLIKILYKHHINVISFFMLVLNKNSEEEPNFELMNQISFAQNRKDLEKLDQIDQQIKNGKVKSSFWLDFRLQNAYAWVTHSNKKVTPKMKKKVKSIILADNWNTTAYHYLSQAVILFDIDEAYRLVDSAFNAYSEEPLTDTFSLQFIALVAVNFLNCCYHQHAKKEYVERTVNFLRNLPIDGAIGINSILGTYYEALFDNDKEIAQMIVKILKKSGYISVIEDTLQ